MTPGFTALTRTCFGANSNAVQRVIWSIALFDIQYALTPGNLHKKKEIQILTINIEVWPFNAWLLLKGVH